MPPSTSSFFKLHFYINVMMRWKGHLFSLSWLETFLYQGFSHELCKFWKHILFFCLDIIFVVLLRSIPLKPWRFQKNPNIVSIFVSFDVVQDFFGSDKDGIWLLNFNFNNFCVMIIVLFFGLFTPFFQQTCRGWTIFKALEKISHHTLVFNDNICVHGKQKNGKKENQ